MTPGIFIFTTIIFYVTFSYSLQRLCRKLNVKPVWLSWTPFHLVLMYKAGDQKWWWFILLLFPFIQLVALIVLLIAWIKIFKKSGWKIASIPLTSLALLLGSIFLLTISFMTSSEPYKIALAEIQRDPDIIRELGQPINAGIVKGGITTSRSDGTACLFIPVSGSQGKGLAAVEAVKLDEAWKLHRLAVKVDKTNTIWLIKVPHKNEGEEPCPNNGFPKTSSWDILQQALAFDQQGEQQQAYNYYTLGMKLDPDNVDFYTNRGGLLTDVQNYEAALIDLNRAIDIDPKNYIAYNNLGIAQGELGDKKSALNNLSKAIQVKPDYDRAYYNRGVYLAVMGRTKEALSDFNQAIKLNKNYLEVYLQRGVLYTKLGKNNLAIQDFQELVKLAKVSNNKQLEKDAKEQLAKINDQ